MFWEVFFLPFLSSLLSFSIIFLSASLYDEKISLVQKFSRHSGKLLLAISGKLYPHIRLTVFVLGFLWALALVGYYHFVSLDLATFEANIVRTFGLTALVFLLIVLTPGLLNIYFPTYGLNSLLINARRSFGWWTFLFAFVHAFLAFFRFYNGSFLTFNILSYPYKLAVIFGAASLLILLVMFITSSQIMVRLLTFRKWKVIHRFIYLAAIFLILHIFLRGSNFNDQQDLVFPCLMIFVCLVFIQLEAGATVLVMLRDKKTPRLKKLIIYPLLAGVILIAIYLSYQRMDTLLHLTY
jgi:methionine sulfoxide reductase heme-binding subunit